jgi:endonuclease G
MKRYIILCFLSYFLVIFVTYALCFQTNDVMLMKHWIELLIIEGFVQEIIYLLKNKKIRLKQEDMKKAIFIGLFFLVATLITVWGQATISKNKEKSNTLKHCVKIKHKSYITMFDTVLKYPVLVHWLNTRDRLECGNQKLERKNNFQPDPELYIETDLNKDYYRSGYDRGHMCPAADNQCDPDMMAECFYFSNMVPQPHATNAGHWKTIEQFTRELTLSYDSVYVWCGSVGSARKINRVTVPTKCWKVIYVVKQKKYYSYIVNNTFDKSIGMSHWSVDVSDVKKLTGFTFNP